jgi:hypothetical protein
MIRIRVFRHSFCLLLPSDSGKENTFFKPIKNFLSLTLLIRLNGPVLAPQLVSVGTVLLRKGSRYSKEPTTDEKFN